MSNKYISGRVKRTPQDQLREDRYKYLNVEQAEPNLGDPVEMTYHDVTDATYDPVSGDLELTLGAGHGLTVGNSLGVVGAALTFKCNYNGDNFQTEKSYPRASGSPNTPTGADYLYNTVVGISAVTETTVTINANAGGPISDLSTHQWFGQTAYNAVYSGDYNKPTPIGNQYQIVSVPGFPGERFWVPIGGGTIPGALSIFDEGILIGTAAHITEIDFRGAPVTATALPNQNRATVRVTPATISSDPPPNPYHGELWWEDDTGDLMIWYQDGTSGQWVVANSGGGNLNPGPKGEVGDKGDKGSQGLTGTQGIKGVKGEPSTVPGDKGDQGQPGEPGQKGIDGDGVKGEKGETGNKGIDGEDGDKGSKGEPDGEKGGKGEPGGIGDKGESGNKGIVGDKGEVGDKGLDGEDALKGDLGDKGIQGDKGIKGDQGDKGLPGEEALKGLPGEKGIVGDKGQAGEEADKGEQGDKGQSGEDSLKGLPGDKGIEGDKGQPGDGAKGNDGDKGQPGEDGIDADKGAPGEKGIEGDKGQPGDGEKGLEGDKGQPGEEALKGLPGEKGQPGEDGEDADKGQEGEKGQPGQGGDGDKGEQGDKGIEGDKGQPGNVGASQNLFERIAVSGQNTIFADNPTDTLTLEAGSNMTITTNSSQDKVTLSATNTNTNTTYSISAVNGLNSDEERIRLTGSNGVTDDVTLEAGSGLSISLSTNPDKITFTNTDPGSSTGAFDKIQEGNTKAEVVDDSSVGNSGHFLVETDATERLRITHNGIVNIGKAAPTALSGGQDPILASGNVGSGLRLVPATTTEEYGSWAITANAKDIVSIFNRTNTRGSISEYKYDASVVGGLEVVSDSLGDGFALRGNNLLMFKVGGATATERLRITSNGAIGLSGANYGTAGQVLTSGGPNGAVTWGSGGGSGGGSVAGSNRQVQFNDGGSTLAGAAGLEYHKYQSGYGFPDNYLILGATHPQDTYGGGFIAAQTKNISSTIQFPHNRAALSADGAVELFRTRVVSPTGGPHIDFKSQLGDGNPTTTSQAEDMDARIQMDYALINGAIDPGDEDYSAISFQTGGKGYPNATNTNGNVVERLRIGRNGEIGIGAGTFSTGSPNNQRTEAERYGTAGQVLTSAGKGSPVYWSDKSTQGGGGTNIGVTGGSLGSSAGTKLILAQIPATVNNASYLQFKKVRDTNGSNWYSAYTRIQQRIDSTDQGYIQFNGSDNSYGMEFGTSNDQKFIRCKYGTPGPGGSTTDTAVELYYNGNEKLKTTSNGITVTGSVSTQDINMSNLNGDANEVDNTKGSWSIQEGSDDLFIINRVTGKKYKFNLTEII